eukprot:8618533-Pyramimonas_sp.AAC.1
MAGQNLQYRVISYPQLCSDAAVVYARQNMFLGISCWHHWMVPVLGKLVDAGLEILPLNILIEDPFHTLWRGVRQADGGATS